MSILEEDHRVHRVAVLLIILLGLIIYSNSISSSFHFDDHHYILSNLKLRDIRNIPLLFHRDRDSKDYRDTLHSRGLAVSTFALNYYLGGLEVEGYHWVNLSLHLLNGILVYFFIRRLLLAKREGGPPLSGRNYVNLLPLFAALFFVANPVQTHGVTYISQRLEEMATLFYLLSLILFIKAVSGKRLRVYPYLGSLFSLLCGLWSKEEVYTAPVMLFLYYLAFVAEDWRRPALSKGLRLLLPYLVLSGLSFYLGVMTAWGWTYEVYWQWGRWEYLLTQASVIVEYIKLLVLPLPGWLNVDVDFPVSRGLWEWYTLFSVGVIALLVGTSIFLLRSAGPPGVGGTIISSKEGRLLAFGVLWFFITLSPSSSVIPIGEVMVVYRLYLPSIGFCLVWVICIHKALGYLWGKGGFGTPCTILGTGTGGALVAEILVFSTILLGYSVGTYESNKVWKDEITLWEDTVKKSPMKARPHCSLGVAYGKKGLYDQAIRQCEEAIRLRPNNAKVYSALGVVYAGKGLHDQAIRQYEEAIRLRPDYAEAYNNLGWVYGKKGLHDQAIRQFEEAVRLMPDYAEAYNNLGWMYVEKDLYDQAIRQFSEAVRLMPDYAEAHYNLGVAYNEKGQNDLAIRHAEQAVRIRPDLKEACKLLDALYRSRGR